MHGRINRLPLVRVLYGLHRRRHRRIRLPRACLNVQHAATAPSANPCADPCANPCANPCADPSARSLLVVHRLCVVHCRLHLRVVRGDRRLRGRDLHRPELRHVPDLELRCHGLHLL